MQRLYRRSEYNFVAPADEQAQLCRPRMDPIKSIFHPIRHTISAALYSTVLYMQRSFSYLTLNQYTDLSFVTVQVSLLGFVILSSCLFTFVNREGDHGSNQAIFSSYRRGTAADTEA